MIAMISKNCLESLDQKNDLIAFELLTVALETYFAQSAKTVKKGPSYQHFNGPYRGIYERYLNQSFNDDIKCRWK